MRAKGEGTIVEKSNGRFLVKVPIGRYPSGATQYKTKWAATKSEANKLRTHLLTERENGRLVAGPKETFRSFADWYYENEAGNSMRPTTIYQQYNLLKNYALPHLGHRPIVDITPREITMWMNKLKEKYSTSTINNTRAAVSGVFSAAVRIERVNLNPVSRTQKLRRGQFEKTQVQPPYSAEEALRLLELAKESDLDAFIHVAVFTGMRRGEILALRWSDIDAEQSTIYINRTLKEGTRFVPGGRGLTAPVFNDPKTKSSTRVVHFSPAVAASLQRHELFQTVQRASLDGDWIDEDLIFTSPCGTAVFPSNYSSRFRKFLKNHGLRHIRIHDLRHTFAVLALEGGVQLAAITQTLGHSGIEITKNIYAKSVPALEVEATNAIGQILDPTGMQSTQPSTTHRGVPKIGTRPGWSTS